ncbi:hypothetical protein BS47DRAFT_1388546 [Hydnum rufescens UP504]|uniref:Uncharacterized protein n=1 Tax=Hydnum rufescens UP504 TaxID=1448309 RepID=A0A9P6B6X6_9AGAM|nr:hypothetical protein BS47DRAFT_1388546 [Hydnum rufescens UP504]
MSSTRRTGGSKASKAKEREGTPKIFEGVEKYTFAASIAAIDREDRDQIQDFALNLSEGWKFGMWNQRGVETTHATNLAERVRFSAWLTVTRNQIGLRREWFENTLWLGENSPVWREPPTIRYRNTSEDGEGRAGRAMDAAQRVHDDLEEMTTEAEKSEGKAQLEELTKTIGSTSIDELPGGHNLCSPVSKYEQYVYLETESERVLLDIQEVRSALKRDDDIWASQIASTGDIKDLELATKLDDELVYLFTVCGTDDVSVCALREPLLQRHYRSLKGMRVLLEGHLSGVSVYCSTSSVWDGADKKEVSTPSEHKRGHHSPAWKRTYVSMCQNMGDPSWLGQMMGMFDVGVQECILWDQRCDEDFLTKSKQYLERSASTCRRCKRLYGVRLRARSWGGVSECVCRLEWLLRHWPYGDEIPVPLLSNTMLEWMEERMKPCLMGLSR